MRAFLELLERGDSLADLEQLAPALAAGERDALRAEGFLQPTGTARFEEVSVPDVIRALRALWGAGSGGVRTRATMSHAPMHLGWFEIDDEPCELILVAGDAHSLAAAARRRHRALVLVPTDRAAASCAQPRLPADSPSSLARRGPRGGVSRPALRWRPRMLTLLRLDSHTILVRFERRSRRVTAEDLGLAGRRSRRPLVSFEMLMAFCDNDGCLPGTGWLARFQVGDGERERERALSPGAREVLERGGMVRRR